MGNQIYDGSKVIRLTGVDRPSAEYSCINGPNNSPKVIFDLFNEPYPDNNTDGGWACWKTGGTCTGIAYRVAGMQSLVSAVRTAGTNNLILVAGIEYANDLSQWLQNEPSDSANNLAVSWHVYPNSNYTGSHTIRP